jgi:hypothetical protein
MFPRAAARRVGAWWLRGVRTSHIQPSTKPRLLCASKPKHDQCTGFGTAAATSSRNQVLQAQLQHRFQHSCRGVATAASGDGDAKQEQLMHHLIDQHVAAFKEEHDRDPSPDELKEIQISMHIFSTLCVGHSVQHGQPVSPEHSAIYQEYAQDSSAIAYFERESAMLVSLLSLHMCSCCSLRVTNQGSCLCNAYTFLQDYAVSEIQRKTGEDPHDSVYKEIYANITKLLAKDTELHSKFMEANAKLQKGLQEVEERKKASNTSSNTPGAALFSSQELTAQQQLKQVTAETIQRIKSAYKQRYGSEPNSDDLREAILEQLVPKILQVAANDDINNADISEAVDAGMCSS